MCITQYNLHIGVVTWCHLSHHSTKQRYMHVHVYSDWLMDSEEMFPYLIMFACHNFTAQEWWRPVIKPTLLLGTRRLQVIFACWYCTYLRMCISWTKGENDHQLQWPFKSDVMMYRIFAWKGNEKHACLIVLSQAFPARIYTTALIKESTEEVLAQVCKLPETQSFNT